jgi:hypothetical protein
VRGEVIVDHLSEQGAKNGVEDDVRRVQESLLSEFVNMG